MGRISSLLLVATLLELLEAVLAGGRLSLPEGPGTRQSQHRGRARGRGKRTEGGPLGWPGRARANGSTYIRWGREAGPWFPKGARGIRTSRENNGLTTPYPNLWRPCASGFKTCGIFRKGEYCILQNISSKVWDSTSSLNTLIILQHKA